MKTYNDYINYKNAISELLHNATDELSVEDFFNLLTFIKQLITEYEEK